LFFDVKSFSVVKETKNKMRFTIEGLITSKIRLFNLLAKRLNKFFTFAENFGCLQFIECIKREFG